jgi:hypothetical protein
LALAFPAASAARKPVDESIQFTNVAPTYGDAATFAYIYRGRLPGQIHVNCYWGLPTVGMWSSPYRLLPGAGIRFGIDGLTGGVPWTVGVTARCQAHLTDTNLRAHASSSVIPVVH